MQFMQPDTIIPEPFNPQSWNRYSYVLNNPINFSDPSGHVAVGDTNEAGCSGKGPSCIMEMYYAEGDEDGLDRSLESFARRHPKYNPADDPELAGGGAVIVAAAYSRTGCDAGKVWDCVALGTIAGLSAPGVVPPAPSFSTDGDFYATQISCNSFQCVEGVNDPALDILIPNGQPIGTQQGRDSAIRTVQSEAELQQTFNALVANGTPVNNPKYKEAYLLPNGGFVGWRNSQKYGPTISINIPGIQINKIHLPK
jgi:hypothetical protein